MAKVKATVKQTLHINSRLYNAGESAVLLKKDAEDLEGAGLLTIDGEAADEETTEKKTSLKFTDNTGKPKEKAEQETDPANPVKKEKAEAGPNVKKDSKK